MAISVTPNLTDISLCESATGWSLGTLDTDSFIQGAGCITYSYATAGDKAPLVYTLASPIDMTDIVLYLWMTFARLAMLNTKALGGLRFHAEDANGYWSEWTIGGKDTLSTAGWTPYCVRTNETPDYTSGTLNKAAVTKVGFKVYLLIKGIIKWDAFRYGTGLTITGGTEAEPGTLAAIQAIEDDVTYRYGVLTKYEGVYYFQGRLILGDSAGSSSTYFKDLSDIVILKDVRIGDLGEIRIVGNTTGTTKVFFGIKSGTAGISGCIFKSAGAVKYKVTATDANITNLGLYGCSFIDAATISLPAYSVNKEVLNCTFEACAMVLLDTCTVENCNFISADDAGARVTETGDAPHFKKSNLISCPYGVRTPNTGTYKFDALKFSGSTSADIDNTSGGLVTVNCVNGANPTTYTGNTVINNYVDVKITVKDEAQANIQGASVRVSKLDDNAVVYMNELTDVNGIAIESINYPGAVSLRIRARKSTTGTRYIPMETTGVMGTTGFSLTVTLYVDGNIP